MTRPEIMIIAGPDGPRPARRRWRLWSIPSWCRPKKERIRIINWRRSRSDQRARSRRKESFSWRRDEDGQPTGRLPLFQGPAPSTLRTHGPEMMMSCCPFCRAPEALDQLGIGFILQHLFGINPGIDDDGRFRDEDWDAPLFKVESIRWIMDSITLNGKLINCTITPYPTPMTMRIE